MTVRITDDTLWTDAAVTLRDASNQLAGVLAYAQGSGTTSVYTKILQYSDTTYEVYADGRDTHTTLNSGAADEVSLQYYTASVTVEGNIPSPQISMTNGTETYNFSGASGSYTALHVMNTADAYGAEKPYTVTVANTIDTIRTQLSSPAKSAVLRFWVARFYDCRSASDETQDKVVKTQYVRDTCILPAYERTFNRKGYSFVCWSESQWVPANGAGTAFDFAQPIRRDVNLYTNFDEPNVTIHSLVYTDASGSAGGSGAYYRMANLTISGFDAGSSAVKNIFLDLTNADSIQLLNTVNMQVKNGSDDVTVSGGALTLTPTPDRIAITFTSPVSMAYAQNYLRSQVIVKPTANTTHTIEVEVTDDGTQFRAANKVTPSQTSMQMTQITSSTWTLNSGNYYVTGTVTVDRRSYPCTNGLTVSGGATVNLYVPANAVLYVYGGPASGTSGAGAGIYVPTNARLNIYGSGTIYAWGGSAARGGDGSAGGNGIYRNGNNTQGGWNSTGNGGAGGYGGGGAGAGIGGRGGSGGSGGSAVSGSSFVDAEKHGNEAANRCTGGSGNSGYSGGSGEYAGAICLDPLVRVYAYGGGGNSSGSNGSDGSYATAASGWSGDDDGWILEGGGGGGAGGGGGGAASIGQGGGGGGGGGSGGSGGSDYDKDAKYMAPWKACASGTGGAGGNGNGGGGSAGVYKAPDQNGGPSAGGSGASAGGGAAAASTSSGTSSFIVRYDVSTTGTARAIAAASYVFGRTATITLPGYADDNPNVIFRGWQVAVYAGSTSSGPLTSAGTQRYKSGSLTLDASAWGDITIAAVTESETGGIRDADTASMYYAAGASPISYNTYTVAVQVDGMVSTSKGTIRIGGVDATPDLDGTYTLVDADSGEKAVQIGGIKVGTCTPGMNYINYETLKVAVTGKTPATVSLDGGPALTDTAGGTQALYTAQRLTAPSKGRYEILVDGQKTGRYASYGSTTTVPFHTVSVTVNAGGVSVSRVELRDAAGHSLHMAGSGSTYTYTALEDSTPYTVYVNGESTDTTASFAHDQSLAVRFDRYTTTIVTRLNGVPTDMGMVTLGGTRMIRAAVGTYSLTTKTNAAAALVVDNRAVRSITQGSAQTIDYYTLQYAHGTGDTGDLPEDQTWYLSGSSAAMLANTGLTKGAQTFAGWQIGSTVYQAGQSAPITAKTTATATWKATDLSTASEQFAITLGDADFTYNGTSQIPAITVTRAGTVLKIGTDYTISYQNTNTANGHNDAAGGAQNTINAGTVTVTAAGTGDYTGTISATYEIAKAPLRVTGLQAIDREYNGTSTVQLTAGDASLYGIVDGDEVHLNAKSVGTLYSPSAGEGRTVAVGPAQLTGAAASEYSPEPIEPVTVNITRKPLTLAMFSAADVQYDGTAKTPALTAEDMAAVGGTSVNLISTADYSYTYTENVHAGTASIIIRAGQPYTDNSGRQTYSTDTNYSGTVTKTFTIHPAPITLTATAGESVYGEPLTDLTNHYTLTEGTICSEADRADLAIHGVTTVQEGYDAGVYANAVQVAWNHSNTDYAVTTIAADYTVVPAGDGALTAASTGYAGIYDGAAHSIRVKPNLYRADETATVYYSTKAALTAANCTSTDPAVGATKTNPAFTDVGIYTVYYFVASPNYAGVAGSETVTITRAPLTVQANEHTITYGEDVTAIAAESTLAHVTVTGLAGSDTAAEALSGSVSYTSNDYARYGDAGTYTLTPGGLSAKNYTITYAPGALKVAPRTVTFAWPSAVSFAYTGSEMGVQASVNGLVNGDAVTVGAYASDPANSICSSALHAGTYTARVTALAGAKAANYTFAAAEPTASQAWSITKAANSWTLAPALENWKAGETACAPTAQARFGTDTITYTYSTSADGDYSAAVPAKAGTYYMKAQLAASDDYSGLTAEPVAFRVLDAAAETRPTVYAAAADKTIGYGEQVGSITVHYTDAAGNTVDADTLHLTGTLHYDTAYDSTSADRRGAGSYALTLSGQSSDDFLIEYRPGTLTVTPKTIGLTWSADELPYTGSAQAVTAAAAAGDLLNGDTVTVSAYTGNTASAAGSYTAKATALAGAAAGNYRLPEDASHRWTIARAANEFVIQPAISGWVYGDDAAEPVGTAKYGTVTFQYQEKKTGIADWSIFNPKTNEVPTQAGTYRLIATAPAGDGYAALTSSETEFTIRPAQAAVIAQDAFSVHGEAVQSPLVSTIAVLSGKLSTADKAALQVQLSTGVTAASAVGTYPITVQYTANSNVIVTPVSGLYTVTLQAMTVTAQPVSVTYDGQPHTIAAPQAAAGGKAMTGAAVYYGTEPVTSQNYGSAARTAPTRTEAGTTTVYYYVTCDNCTPAAGSTTVTVVPKAVTVTAKDAAVVYGEAAKNNGVEYKGFAGSDTAESLGLAPTYTYTTAGTSVSNYAAGSDAGSYQIIPAGLQAANYTFVYQAGTLTVAKKALSEAMFTLSATAMDYTGTAHTPSVTASDKTGAMGAELLQESDYTVSYAQNIHAGTAKTILTAAADGNYTGTAEKDFTIRPLPITVEADPAQSVYNTELAPLSFRQTAGSTITGEDLHFEAFTTVRKSYAAGVYTDAVSVRYDTANTDYTVTVKKADYTVTPATMTVTAADFRGTYDGSAHSAAVTAKTGRFLTYATIYYSDTMTVDASNYQSMTTTMPAFTDAGTHTVYYYAVCDSYAPVGGRASVVILPAALTVTAPDAALTYGDDPQTALSALDASQLHCSGLVGGDTADTALTQGTAAVFATNYTRYGNAGSYQVTVSGLLAKNYTITCKPGTLTVTPRALTFVWPAASFTYSGAEQQITAGVAGKARESDEAAAVCTGDRAADAGEYTARVTALAGAAAANYTFAADEPTAEKTWTIEKAENRFVAAPMMADWTAGTTPSQPYAAAKYGTASFTYSETQDGTYTAAVPTAAGSYFVKATVAETANYTGIEQTAAFRILPEGTNLTTVTITASDKTVTYGSALDTAALSQSDVTVTGLPAGGKLADAATGTLTFATNYTAGSPAGSYLLAVSGLTANAGYTIVYKAGTVTAAKKPIHLVWSGSSYPYTGAAQTVTASVVSSDLVSGDSILVTGYETDAANQVRNTATEAGSYTAHAIAFAGSHLDSYTVTDGSASHAWTITKAETGASANTFTSAPALAGWTYGDAPSLPTGTARYGTIHYVYAAAAAGPYTDTVPTTAGDWYMKAVVDDSASYGGLSSEPVAFAIRKAKVSLMADDVSSEYGSALTQLTYSVSGTIRAGDDLGIRLTTTAAAGGKIGEYPITITCAGNPNYDVTVTNGTYFITPVTSGLQVTASGVNILYDGAAHGITVDVRDAAGNAVPGATVYYSDTPLTDANYAEGMTSSPTLTNAGSRTVYYYVASDTYAPVSGSKTILIGQKLVHVTAGSAAITYGEAPKDGGLKLTGFEAGETAQSLHLNPTLTVAYTQYQDAGTYAITPDPLPENGNYTYNYVSGTLTVSPKPVTFYWPSSTFTYDGTVKRSVAVVKGLVNGDVITVGTYAADTAQNVQYSAAEAGTYTATALTLAGTKASSYKITAGEATASHIWSIGQGVNSFTAVPSITGWTYGQTAAQPQGTAAYGTVSFTYSTDFNGPYTAQQPTDAGTYYMQAVVQGTQDYAVLKSTPAAFSIGKAEIIVTPDDLVGKQGEAIRELTYTMHGTAAAGDKIQVELSTTATDASPADDYLITAAVTASDNYSVTTAVGTYHIIDVSLDLDVTATGTDATYDGQDHGITVTTTGTAPADVYYSLSPISDTSNLAGNAEALTQSPTRRDAGTVTVWYYVVSDTTVLSGSKEVRIAPAPLTVQANDKTISMGDAAANSGVAYTGFIDGEDETVLGGTLQYRYGGYTRSSPDGAYAITPYGLQANNYAITFVPGTLTVQPVRKTTVVSGVTAAASLVYNGKPQAGYNGIPETSAGDLTDFTYEYRDANGQLLAGEPTDAGDYTLTVSVPAANKYYEGSLTLPFSIAKKTVTVAVADQAMLTGQTFQSAAAVYSGFLDADNVGGAAVAVPCTIAPAAGTDLNKAGTAVLEITDPGALTAEAAKNYQLDTSATGLLTIVEAASGTEKAGSSPDGTGSSYRPGLDSGVIQTAVIREPGLPPTTLNTDLNAAVAQALLSADELQQVQNGANALVYLVLSDADALADAGAENAIAAKAQTLNGSMQIGIYFDLAMYKRVGGNAPVRITEAGTKAAIGITLSEDLKLTDDSMVRTYTVLFDHNGVTGSITPTYRNGILYFDTDLFSTYAIAYVDTVKPSASSAASQSSAASTPAATPAPAEDIAAPAASSKKTGTKKTKPASSASGTPAASSGTQQPGSGSTSAGGTQPGNTVRLQPVTEIPKENRLQLADALKKLNKLDDKLKSGFYVQVPDAGDSQDKSQNVAFTIDIPAELQAEGRTFYLVGVDADGKVIVLQNQSMEDGVFSASAAPGTVWQLVYEDGGADLTSQVSGDGTVTAENGTTVRVSTNHCFWHWVILVLAVCGAALAWLLRKKKWAAAAVTALDAAGMVLAMFQGWCRWDGPMLAVGLVLAVGCWLLGRRQNADKQQAQNAGQA